MFNTKQEMNNCKVKAISHFKFLFCVKKFPV